MIRQAIRVTALDGLIKWRDMQASALQKAVRNLEGPSLEGIITQSLRMTQPNRLKHAPGGA